MSKGGKKIPPYDATQGWAITSCENVLFQAKQRKIIALGIHVVCNNDVGLRITDDLNNALINRFLVGPTYIDNK